MMGDARDEGAGHNRVPVGGCAFPVVLDPKASLRGRLFHGTPASKEQFVQ